MRYGVGENLYGIAEIQAFRNGRPANNLERRVTRKSLVTIGDDYGVANIEFTRENSARVGRQSQTWVRFPDGWKVIAAHVAPVFVIASDQAQTTRVGRRLARPRIIRQTSGNVDSWLARASAFLTAQRLQRRNRSPSRPRLGNFPIKSTSRHQ